MELLDFTLNRQPGRLAVDYRANDSIAESGFDMFDPAAFDPALALDYPTIRAWVHEYEGTGYRTASAFIQWIDSEREDSESVRSRELDTAETFRDAKVPFFSYGYPANLYDAPAHNMNGATWMRWLATTWFVTLPARWTNYETRPLVGFQWGYEEAEGERPVVLPLRSVSRENWNAALPWLSTECPSLRLVEG